MLPTARSGDLAILAIFGIFLKGGYTKMNATFIFGDKIEPVSNHFESVPNDVESLQISSAPASNQSRVIYETATSKIGSRTSET